MKNQNKMLKINKNKKAQEEMIGFGIIIAVVSIVILVFLFFSLSSNEERFDSSKVESFIQSSLSYTTECQKYRGEYMDVGDLIYSCADEETCVDGNNSCEVLNSTLNEMINKTWPAGEKWPTKAYEFIITAQKINPEESEIIYSFEKGNRENYTIIKNGVQKFSPRSNIEKMEAIMTVYE